MSDDDDQWWFCLKHNEVEQGTGCANSERMGPYATRECLVQNQNFPESESLMCRP